MKTSLIPTLPVIFFLVVCSLSRCNLCKSIAGHPECPTLSEWQELNATIAGALLRPHPPASSCYTTRTEASVTESDDVTKLWSTSAFHANDPVSVGCPNSQNDGCAALSLSSNGKNFSAASFPKYVLNASMAFHIMEGVNFAARRRVRLVVKGRARFSREVRDAHFDHWIRVLILTDRRRPKHS